MGFSNSKQISLEEKLQESKREINKSIRELERERIKLQENEKRMMNEIRRSAQDGNMRSCEIQARDLVRTRKHQQKFQRMQSQLEGVGMKLQTIKTSRSVAEHMKGISMIMEKMNKELDIPAVQKSMQKFMKESERFGLTEEIMSDVVDDTLGDVSDDESEENVVNQILDEIRMDLKLKLTDAPSTTALHSLNSKQSQSQSLNNEIRNGLLSSNENKSLARRSLNDDNIAVMSSLASPAEISSFSDSNSNRNLNQLEKSIHERLKNLKN